VLLAFSAVDVNAGDYDNRCPLHGALRGFVFFDMFRVVMCATLPA
jgi:hypothetical protein